jgi:hypothetical protein
MFTVAREVFGLQKVPTGGKPFINHAVLAMIDSSLLFIVKHNEPPKTTSRQSLSHKGKGI